MTKMNNILDRVVPVSYTHLDVYKRQIQYRLKKAKKLLLTSNLKVYTIAEMCGFGSVQYFGQIFKKMTGFSPYQFKDNLSS